MNAKARNNVDKDYQVIKVTGSKSASIRALFCAFLANSPSIISNLNDSEDVDATIKSLKELGGQIVYIDHVAFVNPRIESDNEKFKINVSSSATLLRFIIPLFLLIYPAKDLYIRCNDDLLNRDLDGFNKLFINNNVLFEKTNNGYYINGSLTDELLCIDISKSSQYLSALLLVLPFLKENQRIAIEGTNGSMGYVDMTVDMMNKFGVHVSNYSLEEPQIYQGNNIEIEGDYSNVACLFALALNKEEITFLGLNYPSLQGDSSIYPILKNAGADINYIDEKFIIKKSIIDHLEVDIDKNIDLAPILFSLAVSCKNPSRFIHFERLKYKESNRLEEMLHIFDSLEVKYLYQDDELTIYPKIIGKDIFIDDQYDHRIVHALLYLSSINDGDLEFSNIESINKSDRLILEQCQKLINIEIDRHVPSILISISSFKQLSLPADGYVLGYEKFTLFAAHYFAYQEIKSLKNKDRIFILLNALMHQGKMKDYKKELDRLIKLGVNFIVSDIGVLNYLKDKIEEERIIYYPHTLICQKDELKAYQLMSKSYFGISNEITLDETHRILKVEHTFINAFGYVPMYQSYRKVISLYEDDKQTVIDRNNLFIREDTRTDLYHINENEYGSVIFRPHPICYLSEYNYIHDADYIYLDSNYISESVFKRIVKTANMLKNNKINETEARKIINKLPLKFSDEFKYEKTVVRK